MALSIQMLSALYENIYLFRWAARRAIFKRILKFIHVFRYHRRHRRHHRCWAVEWYVIVCLCIAILWTYGKTPHRYRYLSAYRFRMQMLRQKRAFSVSMWLNVSWKVWNGTLNVQRLKRQKKINKQTNQQLSKVFSSCL